MKTFRARAAGVALIAALMLASCGGNTKSPEAVAHAFMDAYKKKDAAGMLALMAEDGSGNRDILQDAAKEGPTGDAYKEVFNAEMMAVMTGKGAKIEGPRYDSDGHSVFKVAEDQGDAYVLALSENKGTWSIAQLDAVSVEEFNAMPAKKPAT